MQHVFADLNSLVKGSYSQYLKGRKVLNLGCGHSPHEGMINADLYHPWADTSFDFRKPWPFDQGELDAVYASHVLEHFSGDDLLDVFWHMGNALKPGGHLVAVVPYGTCELHYANPFHKQAWTLATLPHFNKKFFEETSYEQNQAKPLHNWSTIDVRYRFCDDVPDLPSNDLMALSRHQINIIYEMYFVMRRDDD